MRGFLATLSLVLVPISAQAEDGFTLIAVGGAPWGEDDDTLKALTERLEGADPKASAVIFTGNYSAGGPLPEIGDPNRQAIERDILRHVDAVRSYSDRGGRVIFLPGDLDYGQRGPEGIRRFRTLVNLSLYGDQAGVDDPRTAVPVAACGEPLVIKLSSDAILGVINSQWWMQDFERSPESNLNCTFKNRFQLAAAVNDIVKRWRAKRLVFAMHHPLESLGPYGGRFRPEAHFAPPLIGGVSIWARQSGLVPQYRDHVLYDSFSGGVFASAQKFGGFTFVSGHERSLQVLPVKDQLQVVAGVVERPAPVVGPPKGGFSARTSGWAELTLGTADDVVKVVDSASGEVLFESDLPPVTKFGSADLPPPPPVPEGPVTSTYAEKQYARTGWFSGFLLGRHYRDAYSLELDFPVLDLKSEGLYPFSAGGGNQTNSLFMFDQNGSQWVARSTTKDSGRFLPYPLNQLSFVSGILDDAFTATHPSAAEAVPPLATAAGVYHTTPRLMYIPDQEGLSPYRGFISEEVALLERKAKRPKQGSLPKALGEGDSPIGLTEYEGSDDVLELRREAPWVHRLDQESMLRARLLDIFIGDWDRHEDQWRFAILTQPDGSLLYRPVPEDRDQAFAHYDGFALWSARIVAPEIRVLRPFSKRIRGLGWLIYGSRHFDPVFLNQMDKEEWMATARDVQAALTDDVIHQALIRWPEPAYELDGKTVEEKLKTRRDDLVKAAEKHFDILYKRPDVLGSEGDDEIRLAYAEDGTMRLTIRPYEVASVEGGRVVAPVQSSTEIASAPSPDPVYYDRTFRPEETKEIRLYALAGNDRLVIEGKPHRKFKVRFVGGDGIDAIESAGGQRRKAKGVQLFDRTAGAVVAPEVKITDRRSQSSYRNQYDRKDPHNEPFTVGFFPKFTINPDDGVALGGAVTGTARGFKRSPFASRHTVSALFITSTLGVAADYAAYFPNTWGKVDQDFYVAITTPRFTRNFFGITNLYEDPRIQGRDVFRVRQLTGQVRYGPSVDLVSEIVNVGLQVTGDLIDVENTDGRFVQTSPDVDDAAFNDRYFLGARLRFGVDSRTNKLYPKSGFTFETTAAMRTDMTDSSFDTSATFTGAIGTHVPFDRTGRFVLTTRARAEGIVGDYQFYWAPTVGDRDLRAYNAEQFAGDLVFAHTTDLRVELLRIRKFLPGNIGLAGSIDHGRAFGLASDVDVDVNDYHVSAGGTLFWNVFGLFGAFGSYHRGLFDDTERIVIALGGQFAETGFVLQ